MSKKKKKITKKEQKKRIARGVIVSAAVFVIAFSVTAFLWGTRKQPDAVIEILPDPAREAAESAEESPSDIDDPAGVLPETEKTAAVRTVKPAEEPAEIGNGSILIIIDDVGYNMHQLEPFLRFEGPIVFAVLPGVPYSRQAAEWIHTSGKTCIIHQPMQAFSLQNLGENPILADMDETGIHAVLERSIQEVPHAVGMNNHMGSLITADAEKMEIIMKFLTERGMIFIDSLTTSESAVKKTAEKLDLPYLHRHVFLDNEKTVEYYSGAFEKGLKKAREEGLAVLIGHVWADGLAETLQALYAEAQQTGVNFIALKELEETVIRYAGIGN